MPIVITLCVVGGYAVNNSTFDLLVVAIFGTVGYLMIKCDFPPVSYTHLDVYKRQGVPPLPR